VEGCNVGTRAEGVAEEGGRIIKESEGNKGGGRGIEGGVKENESEGALTIIGEKFWCS